jgi:hypothetical protein
MKLGTANKTVQFPLAQKTQVQDCFNRGEESEHWGTRRGLNNKHTNIQSSLIPIVRGSDSQPAIHLTPPILQHGGGHNNETTKSLII